MEIVVLDSPEGDIVGWEEQFGHREGRFVLAGDGSVTYRHPYACRPWPAGTFAQFRKAAQAWRRYNEAVAGRPEAEQLEAVGRLHTELEELGVMVPGGLWSVLAEQAAAGVL